MPWAKESAKVGLAGYSPMQAAVPALMDPKFQKLPDPLDPLIKELNVSTLVEYSCISFY